LNPQTSSGRHSIWLLPAARDERALSGMIRDLSKRFGTPRFQPHLTLAGDLAAPSNHLVAGLEAIVRDVVAPVLPVAAVETGPEFFRSFYARFERSDTLDTLRERAHDAAGLEVPDTFLPHVSLAYGVAEADRSESRATWSGWLEGMDVRFDRVAVVLSSGSVPIEDWTVIATAKLQGED
jgi:2'-5' RNA ligase